MLRVLLLVGMSIWRLLILWVLVLLLTLLVVLVGRRVLVLVGISLSDVPMHLMIVMSLIGGLLLTFQFLLAFALMPGWLTCPDVCQPVWPACWLDTPDRSSTSSTRVVQDVWDVYRDELGVVPDEVVLALRDVASRSSVGDFLFIWSRSAELGLFRAYSKAGGTTQAGSSAFFGSGLLRMQTSGGRAVGGRGSSKLYRVSQVCTVLR